MTFGPFHPVVEWGLIFHTILGILAVGPVCWYFFRHWRTYRSQAMSDALLLGYAGACVLAVCILSGLILTEQALFGMKTWAWLRYLHLISTLLGVAATLPHLVLALLAKAQSGNVSRSDEVGLGRSMLHAGYNRRSCAVHGFLLGDQIPQHFPGRLQLRLRREPPIRTQSCSYLDQWSF